MSKFCAPKANTNARLDGKTAIITGCNTGIGRHNVLDFCKRGCRVVMACRSVDKAEKARDEILEQVKGQENLGEIVVKSLDLSSLKSVRECAQAILDEEPRIDILVNNAGIMMCPFSTTEDGYESQFATNHLGHFLFTLLLLPRIIRSAPARIVNLSSLAHQLFGKEREFDDINYEKNNYSPTSAYGRSKLANILFTKELATRLEGTNVTTYAVHPGAVNTELTRNVNDAYFSGAKTALNIMFGWFLRTPEQGTQTSIYCAVSEKTANETGLYYADCKVTTPTKAARDMDLAKKVWDMSVEMVQLGDYDPFTAEDKGTKKERGLI